MYMMEPLPVQLDNNNKYNTIIINIINNKSILAVELLFCLFLSSTHYALVLDILIVELFEDVCINKHDRCFNDGYYYVSHTHQQNRHCKIGSIELSA